MGPTDGRNAGSPDWGTAVVVDPKALRRLEADSRKLRGLRRGRTVIAAVLLATSALSAGMAYRQHSSATRLRVKIHECRANAAREHTAPACASLGR